MAYKVFTNGSVLQASEINDNLMRQSVMVFSNAAARTAAITVPLEGMLTWLEDVNRYESYNGTAWVTDSPGNVLITSVDFTSTTQVIINNCFSALYDIYYLTIQATSGGANSYIRMRTGGVSSGTGYTGVLLYGNGGSALSLSRATTGFTTFAGNFDFAQGYLSNPFLTRGTIWHAIANQGSLPGLDTANHSPTTSYESMELGFASASSGTIRIYGLRK